MKHTKDADALVLVPETDLVASAVEDLRDYFSDRLGDHTEVPKVVLDVTDVDLVDSLGVNLVVGLYRQVTGAGKTLEIINAGDNFMKVANFFRLPSLFSIQPLPEG